jgi:hypothetical protein
MLARTYLIAVALAVTVMLVAMPAMAFPYSYSVSVSSYESGPSLSASKMSLLNAYSTPKSALITPAPTISTGKTSAMNTLIGGNSASKGTVSAFSSYRGLQQNEDGSSSYLEFNQKISVSGDIYTFDFSTIFS